MKNYLLILFFLTLVTLNITAKGMDKPFKKKSYYSRAKLHAIASYTGQKVYYNDNKSYSPNLIETGYDPRDLNIPYPNEPAYKWEVTIDSENYELGFIITVTNLDTFESWTINEKKELSGPGVKTKK